MKKNIVNAITLAVFSLFIGFSSIAVAETTESKTSNKEQMVVTLPEVVCTAKRTSIVPEIDYKEYLNEAMSAIRDSLERIQIKSVMEEVKSILRHSSM